MGFTATETINIDRKLAAGVVDAASSAQWYDSKVANIPSVFNKNVLTEFHLVPQASTKAIAQANAVANPTLISDLSQNASAIRLTVVTGTANSTYLATSNYGTYGESVRLRNWIHPTRVALDTGLPSVGYVIRVFQGNPAAGGTEIFTSTGLTGSGVTATPAWIFNYDQGILLISDDYKATLTNPYILGFRYIGKTLLETLSVVNNQAELDAVEAAVGLNSDGTYSAPTGTYVGTSTSVKDALTKLDAAVLAKALKGDTGDTGVAGASAFDIAVTLGFTGTQTEWITSLKGDKGDTGSQGIQGIPGLKGDTGNAGVDGVNGTQGIQGINGLDGLSAYEIALVHNFVGTEAEWLASLVGAKGADGVGSSSLEGLFVLDVTPTSTGIVGSKTYPLTTPANKVVLTCFTDTANVRVTVGIDGSAVSYSPTVTIAGVSATVTESSTIRWFTAVADIILGAGTTVVPVVSNTGATTSVSITLAGAGPNIISAVVGAYPNSQTSLKAGDQITVTVTTEANATEVQLLASGASSVTRSFTVTGTTAVCTLTIGSASGSQVFTFKAKNSFGTYGNNYSTVSLSLDQVPPTFGGLTVTYPTLKGALNTGDTAIVTCSVSNQTSLTYTATGLTVDTPTTYISNKLVTLSSTGYVDSGTNYTITALKASNGSSATKTGLVNIATTAPTAAITTSPTGRMIGSPTGVDYTITITSTQNLNVAPSLDASAGSWLTSWVGSGKVWTRALRISDSTTKGTGVFTNLSLLNQGLVAGTTITSGSTYIVGGFVSKILTFPAFARVVAIGTSVLDQTKTSCQIVGGNVLTRYTDNLVHQNGYYIANSDGSYNATGSYLGLLDSVFAGSNTSGTLQATLVETS